MADIILHHYPTSPYSEKLRAILGYKQLAWKSVHIPVVMPKPDLVALTGGYRKTPVMQIGCDVYCDSKLMARVLDQVQPDPPLIPRGREASCAAMEEWSEKLFQLCVPVVFTPQGLAHVFGQVTPAQLEEFQKDRAALFTGGTSRRPSAAASKGELPGVLARLEQQLAAAPFLEGTSPSLSDFSVYHPLWFVLSNPGVAGLFEPYPKIRAWAQRIAAFGQGRAEPISSDEALRMARESKPRGAASASAGPDGLKPGDRVTVAAIDYGTDAVTGELACGDLYEVAIRRQDERAGEVIVHFPRAGFRIAAG